MDSPLDEVRETVGLRPAGERTSRTDPSRSATADVPPLWAVEHAAGYAAGALSTGTRWFLGVSALLAAVVAVAHQALIGALAHAGGPWHAAYALLAWPTPFVQPILAGTGALVLCVLGVQSDAWRAITRRQGWPLVAGTVAAAAGAAPMVVTCAVIAAVFALIVFVVILFITALITVLLAG